MDTLKEWQHTPDIISKIFMFKIHWLDEINLRPAHSNDTKYRNYFSPIQFNSIHCL